MNQMNPPAQPLPKRFHTQVEVARGHIQSLRLVIALMALICAGLFYGWAQAPSRITVHIPPDLHQGSAQAVDEIPHPNVYTFAAYIWQQMHRWPRDGEKDYASNMFRLQSFVTPRFYEWLDADFQAKASRGELRGKVRGISEVSGQHFEPDRVVELADGVWLVWLDFQIQEWVNDLSIKDVSIRYPMRVVRFDIDREKNPWGLALDGFPEGEMPTRLTEDPEGASS